MASQADRQIRRDPTRRRVKISVKGYSSEACGKRAPAMYSPIVTCQMTIFANLIRRVLLRCGRDHQIWRRRGILVLREGWHHLLGEKAQRPKALFGRQRPPGE